MDNWVYINDDFVRESQAEIHYKDLAIQRGYGVFDFFKVLNKIPVFLEDHLNRFFFSAIEMRLPLTQSKKELKDIIDTLIAKNQVLNCGIRITLTGGISPDGYQLSSPNLIISTQILQLPDRQQFEKGVKLISYAHQRQLPHIKTIDYLMAIWLQPLLVKNKADDILYHQNGTISECPRSNFFIVTENEKIVTPACNILKGITRMKIKEVVSSFSELEERDITISDVRAAKAAFITSTTKMVLPVTQIDEMSFQKNNNIIRKISDQLQLMVESQTQNEFIKFR
ncbi:MAG TPA: aminotransferase class IV [Flavisolibacter sp.]|nr:aminotransferase class IV [Flavisolibacter sp.]